MDSQLSQDSLSSLIPPPEVSVPTTPDPPHATIPESATAAVSQMQANRVENATTHMTPPPSTQVPSSQRGKTRTPTPTVSHISTPPPTIEGPTQTQPNRAFGGFGGLMTGDQITNAPAEELRTKVTELQAAYQEAKMSAAHHRLQYQMLAQESAAAIERMGVEARMAQYENEVLHVAEQAKSAATPAQPSPLQEGLIPVHKDLYQKMCREIQDLAEERNFLTAENAQKEKVIIRQDTEIASLDDKVGLLRERIRENREHLRWFRRSYEGSHIDATPRSVYNDPLRSGVSSQEQPQPFAALLQASEMASQEARSPMGSKKGHSRNTHSTSSLPATPHRMYNSRPNYSTPQGRQPPFKVPSTAPVQRTSALRTPDVYAQSSLPMSQSRAPPSEGTVSGSDHHDDSEAETDIIEQDDRDTIPESQASRSASQILRSSQEQQAKRDSFKSSGMMEPGTERFKQTKLFGSVRKANVDRGDERPAKRARTGEAVGLGIAGVKQ